MESYSKENPLLMIPGPVKSNPEILKAISERVFSHTEERFVDAFEGLLDNLRIVFDVSNEYSPVVISGGGTLAMEISIINLIDTSNNETALICDTGYFGQRFTTIANRFDINFDILSAKTGFGIEKDKLEEKLQTGEYDFTFFQHVDTSTGVANDIETLSKICNENDVISVVDGVCALGGEELHQKEWDIDIYLTGAQKALATPPGLAILMYSPKARELSETRRKKIQSYYSDLDNWWPILDAYDKGSASYFSTPPTNLIVGLYEATNLIMNEGISNVYNRHRSLANKFRSTLEEMGFDFLTDKKYMANTLSTPKYLEGLDGNSFRSDLLDNGVQVAGGIQKGIAEKYFRVGHMGQVSEADIEFTINMIEKSLN